MKRTQTESKKHRRKHLEAKYLLLTAAGMFAKQMLTTTMYFEFPQENSSGKKAH